MHTFRGRRLWIALALGAFVVVGGGIASATIPDSGGTISGCYDKANGKLRLIDTGAGESCKQPEQAISWKQSASLACPSGTTLSTGMCLENTGRAAASHPDAEDACAAVGRRLPSPGELSTFREVPGITLDASGEWTDDLGDTNRSGTFTYFVISDNGNGVADAFDSHAFRCAAGAGIG